MASVVITLEVDDKGTPKIQQVAGTLKTLGIESAKTGVAMGAGLAVGQKALEVMLDIVRSVPAEFDRVISKAAGLADLSAKLDASTASLQRMQYMGSLTGVSMESMSVAALKLQRNLAQHPELFAKWGLSARDLREMKPEQQLVAISDAIRLIGDREHQVAAVTDLLGKGGAENLGLLRQNLSALIEESEQLGVAMGDDLVRKLDDVDDASQRLSASWEALKDKVVGGIVAASGADDFLNNLAKAIGAVNGKAQNNGAFAIWVGLVERLSGLDQIKDTVALLALINEGGPGPQGATKKTISGVFSQPGAVDFDRINADALKVTQEQVKEGDRAAEARRRAAEQAEREAKAAKYTLEIQRDMNKLVDDMLDAQVRAVMSAPTRNLGVLGPNAPEVQSFHFDPNDRTLSESTKSLIADAEKGSAKWLAWGDALAIVAGQIRGPLGSALSGLGGIFDGLSIRQQLMADNLKATGNEAMTTTQKLQAAAQAAAGAYGIYQQAYAGKSVGKGALVGASQGAAAGSQFGAVGAVVGGVVGLGIGIFGAKKGQAAELKALNEEMATLQRQAAMAGVSLDHAFNTKSLDSMRAAVRDLKTSLDMKPMQDEFNSLMHQAELAGVAFKGTFDTQDALALKDAIGQIKDALDLNVEAHQKLQEAAERYGFTIEELGPAWQRQELDKQAAQLYQDWQLLSAAGVDQEALFRRMGSAVSEYVQTAVGAGQEIPAAMQPIIDKLIENGKLVDANGHAYGSAEEAGITYAKTMSQMFEELIQKVSDLVDSLNGVPKNVTSTVTVNTVHGGGTVGGSYNFDGSADYDGDPSNSYAAGFFSSSLSSDMVFKAHRGERVEITPAANSAGRNLGSYGGMTVNADFSGMTVSGGNTEQVLAGLEEAVHRGMARGFVTAVTNQQRRT